MTSQARSDSIDSGKCRADARRQNLTSVTVATMARKRKSRRAGARERDVTRRLMSPYARRRANRMVGGFAAAFILGLGLFIWHVVDDLMLDLVVYSSGNSAARATEWVEDLRGSGFHVHHIESQRATACPRLRIPKQFAAEVCAVTQNPRRYVLSGFVPARTISRLLNDRPAFDGLAVPDNSIQGSEPQRAIWGFWADGHGVVYGGSES